MSHHVLTAWVDLHGLAKSMLHQKWMAAI